MKTALILVTYNAEKYIEPLMLGLLSQSYQPDHVLVIDSSSKDRTQELLVGYPVQVHVIPQSEFNHGGTRDLATKMVDADVYIFMTQDAYLAEPDSLKKLMAYYDDPKVGCVYGRQLPHKDANLLARHAREFNYPAISQVKSKEDISRLGIKTCFNSNSFSSYRATAYIDAKGFPDDLILGEDAVLAANMVLKGWKVAYAADSTVHHSHNYTFREEFKRYFDIGAFHAMESWLIDAFKSPIIEGGRYVKSELVYCFKQGAVINLVRSMIMVWMKYLGYKLGLHYKNLPKALVKRFSMHAFFWK